MELAGVEDPLAAGLVSVPAGGAHRCGRNDPAANDFDPAKPDSGFCRAAPAHDSAPTQPDAGLRSVLAEPPKALHADNSRPTTTTIPPFTQVPLDIATLNRITPELRRPADRQRGPWSHNHQRDTAGHRARNSLITYSRHAFFHPTEFPSPSQAAHPAGFIDTSFPRIFRSTEASTIPSISVHMTRTHPLRDQFQSPENEQGSEPNSSSEQKSYPASPCYRETATSHGDSALCDDMCRNGAVRANTQSGLNLVNTEATVDTGLNGGSLGAGTHCG